MKAIGFTPAQVTGILVGQMLVPVGVGALAGVVAGTLASEPIIAQTTMSFGLPASFAVSPAVILTILGVAIVTAIVASVGPAIRAGRLSAVAAISGGSAPSRRPDGGRLRRLGLALPVPLPARLGVAAGLAHPGRAAMTLGALVVGVVAVVFALGLDASLLRIVRDLDRAEASPVRAELGRATDGSAVTGAIAADPDTGRFVAIGQGQVGVAGLGSIPFVGYDGDASWLGYRLIAGRWFTGAGEVVAPTNVFRLTGLHIGDAITVARDGRQLELRLVGEILDIARESPDDLVLRGAWADLATLVPGLQPGRWEMQPRAGVEPAAYRSGLQDATGRGVPIFLEGESTSDESFVLFLTVVGVLGIVLVVTAFAGVVNTVLLETRQRTREIAVLKATGLTPRQVLGMVVASIVPVGLAAGLLGLPLGLLAQRAVLAYMGEVAAKTAIPAVSFDVFPPVLLAGLAVSGLVLGIAGAIPPAQRAARARIAPVLQAE
jgi:putative ABC transport system permease protein